MARSSASPTREIVQSAVWGDGFADDAWPELTAVDGWATLHPDEYLRLFPRLAAPVRDPRTSATLLRHLDEAIAVWTSRLGEATRFAGSGDATVAGETSQRPHGTWFGRPSWIERARDRVASRCRGASATRSGDDMAALDALVPVRSALQRGEVLPFSEPRALAIAFYAAIHPAYLWPAALAFHECATATGWLGVVARRRPALMPLDVATFLGGAIDLREANHGRLHDGRLALCTLSPSQWAVIARAAQSRIAGRREVVRLPRAGRWLPVPAWRPGPVNVPATLTLR